MITYYVGSTKGIFFLPIIFARNVKINMHLIVDGLSPFFLDSFMSWICVPEDVMGKDRINVFLESKLTNERWPEYF
jgi:hypothetical protein